KGDSSPGPSTRYSLFLAPKNSVSISRTRRRLSAVALGLSLMPARISGNSRSRTRLYRIISRSEVEIILYNRVRLLEFPEILAGIKLNPNATADSLRLVREIETEFFGAKKSEYRVEGPGEESPFALEEAPIEETEALEDLTLEGLPTDPVARELAILERLARMTVRDKIKLALMGTREERGILIRDANREIARTVLK